MSYEGKSEVDRSVEFMVRGTSLDCARSAVSMVSQPIV